MRLYMFDAWQGVLPYLTFNIVCFRRQIITNVGGTQEVIYISRKLKKLDAFVHLSTAYCNPIPEVVGEKIYLNQYDPKELLEFAK